MIENRDSMKEYTQNSEDLSNFTDNFLDQHSNIRLIKDPYLPDKPDSLYNPEPARKADQKAFANFLKKNPEKLAKQIADISKNKNNKHTLAQDYFDRLMNADPKINAIWAKASQENLNNEMKIFHLKQKIDDLKKKKLKLVKKYRDIQSQISLNVAGLEKNALKYPQKKNQELYRLKEFPSDLKAGPFADLFQGQQKKNRYRDRKLKKADRIQNRREKKSEKNIEIARKAIYNNRQQEDPEHDALGFLFHDIPDVAQPGFSPGVKYNQTFEDSFDTNKNMQALTEKFSLKGLFADIFYKLQKGVILLKEDVLALLYLIHIQHRSDLISRDIKYYKKRILKIIQRIKILKRKRQKIEQDFKKVSDEEALARDDYQHSDAIRPQLINRDIELRNASLNAMVKLAADEYEHSEDHLPIHVFSKLGDK